MDTRTGQVFEATREEMGIVRNTLGADDPVRFAELLCKPNQQCRRCRGRGTVKSWGTGYKYGACPVCYPSHPQKAQSFNQHISTISKEA
jgi:hypothetical protein